jgi:hypothetical protein
MIYDYAPSLTGLWHCFWFVYLLVSLGLGLPVLLSEDLFFWDKDCQPIHFIAWDHCLFFHVPVRITADCPCRTETVEDHDV